MMYINQIIKLYTLNLYLKLYTLSCMSVIAQWNWKEKTIKKNYKQGTK